ncbi:MULTISPECIES: sodium/proline symporter [Clostridium]|uniref:Sodium/proline symporter n=1 Tax=Clostridium cadaveris TaxID=1529 RepID=A0A1I2NWF7_9CLOT|nr:sodium/proline symporter [Clostridium cadaveris]MDU4951808.1 sodium/proline symporter [Clostridium sp.]MDM8312038.1 sodium/proline symporter [Clostridium cadaveris]NME64819.1 sodium/proline symporter [Clostridium cadaveris]NWK12197.1 sodium/proline symporter [Clostridium cadaveris]PWL53970.1 MAG: sodium/proline symporter [Clostridium cadaveris]
MNKSEFLAIILYLGLVIGIGIYFFIKSSKSGGEKEYFLGGRNMSGLVAALSAGASDMSAWILMGLPGSIYLYGVGQVWISVGLLLGTLASWLFVAPRLRIFSIQANDSITIPQFLTNRFKTKNISLQVISAIVFIIVYCIYAASSIYACGQIFNLVLGIESGLAMLVATIIIVTYTFLGGFNAVCWTDFFQGMLMLGALFLTPLIVLFIMNSSSYVPPEVVFPENYYNFLSSGSFDWKSISDILTGIGWGLGYFGMPHILIRYISIKSEKEMKKSQKIGCLWTCLILILTSIVGIMGRHFFGDSIINDPNLVFIKIVRVIFPGFIAGIFLSAIIAAAMSSADSQLLASSSAFASDVYKPLIRKNASNEEMMRSGRIIVIVISIVAYFIANSPQCSGIMALVSCAWGGFGSAFGPVIILSLYWKRFTYSGAIAGISVGFLVDGLWYVFLSSYTGIYEIIPGFLCGLLAAVIVSLISKNPSQEVCDLFDSSLELIDSKEIFSK